MYDSEQDELDTCKPVFTFIYSHLSTDVKHDGNNVLFSTEEAFKTQRP